MDARVVLPPALVVLVDKLTEAWGVPWESTIRLLLNQLDARLEEGDASMFSLDVQHKLRDVRDGRYGVIGGGEAIDYSKLHKSERTKSGFIGVYANGKGFRAMAKDPKGGGERSIGTFPTAIEAAWRRYVFYRSNRLPYGELEIEMNNWRNPSNPSVLPFRGTDQELIEAIRTHTQFTGTGHIIFGVDGENEPVAEPVIAGFEDGKLPPEAQKILDAADE